MDPTWIDACAGSLEVSPDASPLAVPMPDERHPEDAPEPDPAERTIDPENEVDEALYETFPASDAPGYTGGSVTPTDYEDKEE